MSYSCRYMMIFAFVLAVAESNTSWPGVTILLSAIANIKLFVGEKVAEYHI